MKLKRTSAKAIIIQHNRLLTLKIQEESGIYYILPGGGQHHEENLHEALERECMEELGTKIGIGDLLFVREYIGKNHEVASYHAGVHVTEFMFLCSLKEQVLPVGTDLDSGQIGVEWLPLDNLLSFNLLPADLRPHMIAFAEGSKTPVYVGDIN